MISRTALLVLAVMLPIQESEWDRMLKETGFTLTEAIERGQKEAGNGIPFHAELEDDKGQIVYSIDVAQGRRNCNVVMSAKEGKVVEKDVEEEDHTAEVGACKITLAAAIQTALAKKAGKAVEAHLVMEGNRPIVRVSVYDGKLSVVRICGVSGELLASDAPKSQETFTDRFMVDPSEWSSTGSNPYFRLEPGYTLVLESKDMKLTITVLSETKKVDGVETRVVEEREEEDGKLIEVSRNYFAISKKTNSVYYFGEDVDIYKDGQVVGHSGAWLSGEKGARFGLMMPGTPLLGARYYQEIAPGVAMDRAEIVSLAETIETAAGRFTDCLRTDETTPLEKGRSVKVYAPGIGLVRDDDAKLVRHGFPKK